MDKYSYLKIPLDYVCVYNKLAYCLYAYGIDIIKDCTASCKANNKDVIEYWNLFQLAIVCFEKNEIDKANYFIDYIKANLDRIYNSINAPNYKGANNYFIDDEGNTQTCIVCNDWMYELSDFDISYTFTIDGGTVIEDDGKGQTLSIQITSTKTISNGEESETINIPFSLRYNKEDDENWIVYNYYTKTLTIQPNSSTYRTAKVYFEQNNSEKRIELTINQAKNTTEYEYYLEYEPQSFAFEKEGGSIPFNVTRCSKRKLEGSLPVGDDIPVEWNAKVEGYGFEYNDFTNTVVAQANNYKERTGKLIISRAELGSSKNVEIPITQKAGEATIVYNLQVSTDNNILPPINAKVQLTVVSTRQKYYGGEPVGEVENVPFTIISSKGYLTGINENNAIWNMTENVSEVSREDTLVVTQNSAEGKRVEVKIIQQAAVIDYNYIFRTDNDTICFEAIGGSKTISVVSTKQKIINGRPVGDVTNVDFYNSSIVGDFIVSKNTIITANENSEDKEKTGNATFVQTESSKTFNVNLVQNAASETYEYTFSVVEGTGKVSFGYEAGQKTFNIKSEKQKKLNGSPSGGKIPVPFKSIIQGNGFSIGEKTDNTVQIKVNENKTTSLRIGSIKFVQEESETEIPISLEQAAGSDEWRYTFEVTETEFYVPNYLKDGIVRNFTIKSYKQYYINGVYQDKQENVPYNVVSNQLWCKVNNNSTQIFVDENRSDRRTAVVTINQTETSVAAKTINIQQDAMTSEVVYTITANGIIVKAVGVEKVADWTIKKSTIINKHEATDVQTGIITKAYINDKNNPYRNYFIIAKQSDTQVRGHVISGIPEKRLTCKYTVETSFGKTATSFITYDFRLEVKLFRTFRTITKDISLSNVYLIIKENYITTYQKLLTLIINHHKAITKKPNNKLQKYIIDCWNLFQSAVASYNLGFEKQADFFINFIDCNVNKIIENIGIAHNEQFDVEYPDMIGFVGKLDLDAVEFYTDVDDGNMYIKHNQNINSKDIDFNIKNNGNLYQTFK